MATHVGGLVSTRSRAWRTEIGSPSHQWSTNKPASTLRHNDIQTIIKITRTCRLRSICLRISSKSRCINIQQQEHLWDAIGGVTCWERHWTWKYAQPLKCMNTSFYSKLDLLWTWMRNVFRFSWWGRVHSNTTDANTWCMYVTMCFLKVAQLGRNMIKCCSHKNTRCYKNTQKLHPWVKIQT